MIEVKEQNIEKWNTNIILDYYYTPNLFSCIVETCKTHDKMDYKLIIDKSISL